jgi:hypothetical protein
LNLIFDLLTGMVPPLFKEFGSWLWRKLLESHNTKNPCPDLSCKDIRD